MLLYGAAGFTGQLIAAELLRCKAPFVIAGRASESLRALGRSLGVEAAEAGLDEPAALERLFARASCVIAAAGPFAFTGEPLLQAAMAASTQLIDLSGEPSHLQKIWPRRAEVETAGIAVVHSVGFDVVPAELLAKLCATGMGSLASLELATGHLSGAASHGTLKSYQGMSSKVGLAWVDSALVDEPIGLHRQVVSFSPPLGARAVVSLGSAEVVLLPRSIPVDLFRHYAGSLAPAALPIAERSLVTFSKDTLAQSLHHLDASGKLGPDAAARENNQFFLWCRARSKQGACAEMTMHGRDPYGLSAVLAAHCATLAASESFDRLGVLTPAQAFDVQPLLAVLANHGARWQRRNATNDTSTHAKTSDILG